MGKDNQPKHRQKARDLRRHLGRRAPYERVLIVCEGEKTEVNYLKEIQAELRLSTANVEVQPGAWGTDPLKIVDYAEHLFRNGDRSKGIEPLAFDRVVVVFDRDDHRTYFQALAKTASLNYKVKNDNKEAVVFQAVASVPCFELWLLLHFEDIQAAIHRDEVYARLLTHIPNYEKGQGGHWLGSKDLLGRAMERAITRAEMTNAYNGVEPFSSMYELIWWMLHLKD